MTSAEYLLRSSRNAPHSLLSMIRTSLIRQRPQDLTELVIDPAWISFSGAIGKPSTKAPEGVWIRCAKNFDVQVGDLLGEPNLQRMFVVRQVAAEQTTNQFFCGEIVTGNLDLWSLAQLTTYDLTLTHPAVNGGNPSGFVLWSDESASGEVLEHREGYLSAVGTWLDRVSYTMRLVFADEEARFNGNRSSGLALLRLYLTQRTNLVLTTKYGAFPDLHSSLQYAEASHQMTRSIITVVLNNGGWNESVPIDFAALNASTWDSGLSFDDGYFS
jgi:hypothetical protein